MGSKEQFMAKFKEFGDEREFRGLYAKLQARNVNPSLYDNKLKFWKEVILCYQRTYCKAFFSEEELMSFFEWKNFKPTGLTDILKELLRTREIINIENFHWEVNEKEKESWLSFSLRLSLLPFSFFSSSSPPLLTCTNPLQEESIRFMKEIDENVREKERWVLRYSKVEAIHASCQLIYPLRDILNYLKYEGKAHYCYDGNDLLGVKFDANWHSPPASRSSFLSFFFSSNSISLSVSEIELNTLSLRSHKHLLSMKLSHLNSLLSRNKEAILKAASEEQKKVELKKRMLIQRNITNLQMAIHKLREMLLSIENAAIQQKVLGVSKVALECLRNLNSAISKEEAEQLTDDIAEMVEHQTHLLQSLSSDGSDEFVEEEEELRNIISPPLPNPPSTPPRPQPVDEDDLEELIQSLGDMRVRETA